MNKKEEKKTKLESGHFNLFPVFKYVAEHPKMDIDREYSRMAKEIVANVPHKLGWYFWGKFNDVGWWETVYLGIAKSSKTSSLNIRLYDEIRKEAGAFWGSIYGRTNARKQHREWRKLHPKSPDYSKNLERSFWKIGSEFVIWVGIDNKFSGKEIEAQESALIKTYRPKHNLRRPGQVETTELTEEIEKYVENEIQKILGERK